MHLESIPVPDVPGTNAFCVATNVDIWKIDLPTYKFVSVAYENIVAVLFEYTCIYFYLILFF